MLKVRTVLGKLGKALLLLLFLGVTYVFVALLNPETEEAAPVLALVTASPAVYVEEPGDLNRVIAGFPVPVLAAGSDSVLQLSGGVSRDTAFENGFGRVLILDYLYGENEIEVTSIYPARALELLGREDYHISTISVPLLAGWNAVRMENGSHIRLHFQTDYGLYAVRIPREAGDAVPDILRPLQLMTVSGAGETD